MNQGNEIGFGMKNSFLTPVMTHLRNNLIGGLTIAAIFLGVGLSTTSLSAQDTFLSEDDLFEEELEEVHTVPDPLIGLNRTLFKFNDFFYMKVLGPVAHVYHDVTPDPVENGFSNFFDNVKFPVRLAGNLLQLKVEESFQETGKFVVNSTIGLGGFHKASDQFEGLNPPVEDIGQALGAWGIGEGFYIVLPFLGPTNARDFVGRYGDRWAHPVSEPWTLLDDSTDRTIFGVVDFVSDSPRLMSTYMYFTESAIDPYEAMKDGFSQYRLNQISE
jgi:phospholipid-binding lipoprotein MlaA